MTNDTVTLIPISEIAVLNPRSRNRVTFEAIVASIKAVGLKKPISVNRRKETTNDGRRYDLICGQGRLEAFQALGQDAIPAIVRELTNEECLLRSLAENIARRRSSAHALYREVRQLKLRGYKPPEISRKLGIHLSYIHQLVNLLDQGETQLLKDVEMRRVPLTVAITIATGSDGEIQRALSDAYQKGELRGAKLETVKRIIARRSPGRDKTAQIAAGASKVSSATLIREYRRHTERQNAFVQNAVIARRRILMAASAMKRLLADENFKTLLRAELTCFAFLSQSQVGKLVGSS
jgi:ParB family chromosome partitioning protein